MLRNRNYFFDPTFPDRFNTGDIPTEMTFRDFADSVPFIKENFDRAKLTRAGISKTTTDYRVNNRIDQDTSGDSPAGFTTFVKPSQLFKLLPGNHISLVDTPRSGVDPTQSENGYGINDITINVDTSNLPFIDDLNELNVRLQGQGVQVLDQNYLTGSFPFSVATETLNPNPYPAPGLDAHTLIYNILDKINETVAKMKEMSDLLNSSHVRVGDVIMTTTPPSSWNSSWLEPNGQVVSIALYPVLHALFGSTYNTGGEGAGNFRLPNWTNNKYLLATSGVGLATSSGGINGYTLGMGNIPTHNHPLGANAVVSTNGSHVHKIIIRNGDGSSNFPDNSQVDGPINNDCFTQPAGDHNHTLGGTTENAGSLTPTPVPITPVFNGVYLKMRAR